MSEKLTKKQQRFVDEYLADPKLNATQAAIRAGFSKKTAYSIGHELLTKDPIKKAIEVAQQELKKRTEITQDWVLNNLKSVAERCMEAEQVVYRGQPVEGAYQFDSSGANRALELIGKHLGMFKDKLELTGKDGGAINTVTRTMTEQEATQVYTENLKK